jgi:sucrose-6-phosphate hydrolase SacC (GH32 family)
MAVALPNDHQVLFYGSSDLKTWTRLSTFGPAGATGGQWECPTLVEVPFDGDAKRTRWVLKVGLNPGGLQGGSGEQYFVGTFDGTRFLNDNPATTTLWTDFGKDCYCALVFNGMPNPLEPVMMGWMSNWQYAAKVPTKPWRGQMTIPRRLVLKTTPEGIRLLQQPIEASAGLRARHFTWQGENVAELNRALKMSAFLGHSFELHTTVAPGKTKEFGWKLLGGDGSVILMAYDSERQELFVDRTHSGNAGFSKDFPMRTSARLVASEPLRLTILVDRSSAEIFAQDGRVAITDLVYPPDGSVLQFYSKNSTPSRVTVDLWNLGSSW